MQGQKNTNGAAAKGSPEVSRLPCTFPVLAQRGAALHSAGWAQKKRQLSKYMMTRAHQKGKGLAPKGAALHLVAGTTAQSDMQLNCALQQKLAQSDMRFDCARQQKLAQRNTQLDCT
eukprot:1148778-Pelagomonas_calceolata.AAC.10